MYVPVVLYEPTGQKDNFLPRKYAKALRALGNQLHYLFFGQGFENDLFYAKSI
jgi:hypothetical protein